MQNNRYSDNRYILAKKITDSDIKYRYILIHQLISFHTWNILSLQ